MQSTIKPSLIALILLPGQVLAAGFQLAEQSATGMGRAFAGEAAIADNASVLARNAAAMTRFERTAFSGGWSGVKLYFMLGLPTETVEDMQGIAELSEKVAEVYYDTVPKEKRNGKCQITISTSFFVPKPFTPFQWAGMYTPGDYLARARVVNEGVHAQLNHKSIKYNWHEADVTLLEGLLARGDRRVGRTILKAYENGALYDAWSETFHYEIGRAHV